MKTLLLGIIALALSALSHAQGTAVGAGAIAGSQSASIGFASVGLNVVGTAGASVVVKNEGSASASTLPVITPLGATGTTTSINTTTVTPTITLPSGGRGFAGGLGYGQAFAAAGAVTLSSTNGPAPVLPPLLPIPPILGTLPVAAP